MSDSSLTLLRSKDLHTHVQRCVKALSYVAGSVDTEEAKRKMALVFSQSAAPPELHQCTGESIAYAIALSAISGLYPGGPHPDVWIIPRRNQGAFEANWQISARGYARLARRVGYEVTPRLVFEGERFEVHYGTEPSIAHDPLVDIEPSWELLRAGYVVVRAPNGATGFDLLRKAEIIKRRNKAQTQKVWNEWPLEMARKTVMAWAGARELWPLDDPARYALRADQLAEIGEQVPPKLIGEGTGSAPTVTAADFGESPEGNGPEPPPKMKAPEPAPEAKAEAAQGPPMAPKDVAEFKKALKDKGGDELLSQVSADIGRGPDEWREEDAKAIRAALRGAAS